MPLPNPLLQARFGIARFGATRFGYFFPNLIIKVAGTDITKKVRDGSLEIEDVLHQANTCFFEVEGPTTAIVADDTVMVATGRDQDGCRDFVGLVTQVIEIKGRAGEQSTFRVECTEDATWELDRLLINQSWTSTSASTIVTDIITASGSSVAITAVQTGLATVDAFSLEDKPATEALTDLATMIGATWYVRDDVLHFFTSETVQDALPLDGATTHWWDLEATRDIKELCTRVIAEGGSQTVLIDVPAGSHTLPLDYGWAFLHGGGVSNVASVRWAGSVSHAEEYYSCSHILGPPARVVAVDANPGDTSIQITATAAGSDFDQTSWATDAAEHLFFYTGTVTGPPHLIFNIPASGYGAITATIPAGTAIFAKDDIAIVGGIGVALRTNDTATFRVELDDAAAQATYGVRTHKLDMHATAPEEVVTTAQAYLDVKKSPITSIKYKTRERYARSGGSVSVGLTDPAILDTFTIQEVKIMYKDLGPINAGTGKAFPIREVTAAPTRLLTLVDLLAKMGA